MGSCLNPQYNDVEVTKWGRKYVPQNLNFNSSYNSNNAARHYMFSRIANKVSKLNIKINLISKEYFNDLINQNPKAREIINYFTPKIQEINNICSHGTFLPPLRYTNSTNGQIEYYEGEFNEMGQFDGMGTHIFDNNCVYIGQFKNDQYNGTGLMISNEGSFLLGDWVNGDCNGKGHLIVNGQLEYEGDFANNLKNGMGVEKYPDGSVYEGNFINGEKSGQGKYTFPNGEFYEGNFENDLYNGEGVYEWPSEGRVYRGHFKNGNMEGMGENKYRDGSVYSGSYYCGMKHGDGTYTWPDGKKFTGQWINKVLHGNGYFYVGSEKYEVTFRSGKIISSRSV